jgi:hypothetical protein
VVQDQVWRRKANQSDFDSPRYKKQEQSLVLDREEENEKDTNERRSSQVMQLNLNTFNDPNNSHPLYDTTERISWKWSMALTELIDKLRNY